MDEAMDSHENSKGSFHRDSFSGLEVLYFTGFKLRFDEKAEEYPSFPETLERLSVNEVHRYLKCYFSAGLHQISFPNRSVISNGMRFKK